ncbi:hypothetical protein ACNFJ7_09465 [Sphingomonas sp. HT-1]|uniref:hypothetical protein n=1 Tax=unclassified Sphingomonas TaxID=196159 RepID=UPI000ACAF264|nr:MULTISPECIES: hypothetical protein [unclassified Sphingomonas]
MHLNENASSEGSTIFSIIDIQSTIDLREINIPHEGALIKIRFEGRYCNLTIFNDDSAVKNHQFEIDQQPPFVCIIGIILSGKNLIKLVVNSGRPDRAISSYNYTDNINKLGDMSRADRRRNFIKLYKSDIAKFISSRTCAAKSQYDQLLELRTLVEEGKLHHLEGCANIIRKLLGSKDRILLDICALKNRTIEVSTSPIVTPPKRPGNKFSVSLAKGSSERFPVKVNLEAWLGINSCIVAGHDYSNQNLIDSIGNKIGAHNDRELGNLLSYLQELKISNIDYVSKLIHSLSSALLEIIDENEWVLQT